MQGCGKFQDTLYGQELNAVVGAEGSTFILPPDIEVQFYGIAFAGIDNGLGIGRIGHQVNALIADEPETFAGVLIVKRSDGTGGADSRKRLFDGGPRKM